MAEIPSRSDVAWEALRQTIARHKSGPLLDAELALGALRAAPELAQRLLDRLIYAVAVGSTDGIERLTHDIEQLILEARALGARGR